MSNIARLSLLILFTFSAGLSAFADGPKSSDANSPQTNVQTPILTSDGQVSYVYDLQKLIKKSRANIKRVNEKIKAEAVRKRNQQREERAREYYQQGVDLTKQGKLDEARDCFEKAISITSNPEMAGYIKESKERLRRQESALRHQEKIEAHQNAQDEQARRQEVESAYNQAVALYKEKKYHPAKDAFDHVEDLSPDYRATSSYLKLLDQDISQDDAVAAKTQKLEIQRQQKAAEAARAREKEAWHNAIAQKEKQRKAQIQKQADQVYRQAVQLYKQKKFAEAKKKFQEVEWVLPDYRAASRYLEHIDRDAEMEKERLAKQKEENLAKQRWEAVVQQKKQEALRQQALKQKELDQQKQLQEQAEFLYQAAVSLYDKHQWNEALAKFNSIEKICPDYKATRRYISRLQDRQKKQSPQAQQVKQGAATKVSIPPIVKPALAVAQTTGAPSVVKTAAPAVAKAAAVKPAQTPQVSLEDQKQQAQAIAKLAAQSAALYRSMADIANDRPTKTVRRQLARVDTVLKRASERQERLLRRLQEHQQRQQQEQRKTKQDQRRAQAETLYQQAMDLLSSKQFDQAKIKLLQLETVYPDYKATREYLARINDYKKQAASKAVTVHEQQEALRLKALQAKQDADQQRRKQQQEQQTQLLQQQQQAQLQELVQKASALNEQIISLSKQQDYPAMQAKFTELQTTVGALKTLKEAMIQQQDRQQREKQLAQANLAQQRQLLHQEKSRDRRMRIYANTPETDNQPILSKQPDLDQLKRRDMARMKAQLFSQGVDLYRQKKYVEAKLLFGELAAQHDSRAEAWIKKSDRGLSIQVLKSKESAERERTAFLADQLAAQRKLEDEDRKERLRQKKLTEELEHQKRLYQDQQIQQERKQEALGMQERERLRQEKQHQKIERQNERQAKVYRFRVIKKPKPQVVPKPAPKAVASKTIQPPVPSAAAPASVAKAAPALTPREARLKERQERQARKRHLRELAREARQKAIQEQKAKHDQQAKAAQQKLAEEKKHREELRAQQEQVRKENIKSREIIQRETQRQAQIERTERQRQAQLKAQREAIHKQLEDGVADMYGEALRLYKQGQYAQAAQRFQDVEDILPNYKNTRTYIQQAKQKASDSLSSSTTGPSTPVGQGNFAKAMDVFDPHGQ